jgi:hypothetical protein
MNGGAKVPFSWQRVAQQMSQELASMKLELAVTSDALEASLRRIKELEEELGGVDPVVEEQGGVDTVVADEEG